MDCVAGALVCISTNLSTAMSMMMKDSKMDLALMSTSSLKLIFETWILRADT